MSHHHPVSTAVLAGSWIRTRATRTPTSTWKWDADVTSGLTYRATLVKLVVSIYTFLICLYENHIIIVIFQPDNSTSRGKLSYLSKETLYYW